ncbi:VanZ family protein [Halorubrum halophilum]|uniref:VanZ family protein n=1 Tax=Halorubrum halophilum TaxID=413816 RepID=UPI000679CED7|nr:VanZ family protein [Halorubrum halophilum]
MRRLRLPLIPNPLRWGAVFTVAGIILYYSIRAGPGTGTFQTGPLGLFPYSDWLHFLAYACLAVMLAYALQDSRLAEWQVFVVVFVCAVGFGVTIELLQSRLPSRTFAFGDMGVNAVGSAVAVVCWRVLVRYVRFYRVARPADLEPPIS